MQEPLPEWKLDPADDQLCPACGPDVGMEADPECPCCQGEGQVTVARARRWMREWR